MPKSNNNSDYTKPRLNLFENLPEVLQSDTNRSVFSNLFDRYLTKQEVKKVAGYIGKGNRNAIQPRQIQEPTVHRQAFQLQPMLYSKIGSVRHMSSWMDILNELTRLGVDVEECAEWGKAVKFNWVPPVDIDKIIHYQDYYWFDEENPNSIPEYITIRSRCTTAIANANFWQSLNDEFGSTINIKQLLPIDDITPYPSFNIISIIAATNTIVVDGDITSFLQSGQFFDLSGNLNNNGTFQSVTTPIYDGISQSTITVAPLTFSVNDVSGGLLEQRRFDKIVLDGEFIRLFDPGFVFFLRESTNNELNDAFWQVTDVKYDEILNETILTINTTTTSDDASGVVSLEEQLNFYLAERDCQCTGSIGWDLLLWDDNPDIPLWDNPTSTDPLDPVDHPTLLVSISNVGPPTTAPTGIPLWYDTDTDIVYQYQDTPDFTGWKLLWNKFSNLLDSTQGLALWNFTPGCGIQTIIPAAEQWTDTNFWFHKSDVPSFSIAKQAQFPIIEYDWDLELNEWSFSESVWKYRKDRFIGFETTDKKPSLLEIIPLSLWEDSGGGVITFDERYGNMTDTFIPGFKFQADGISVIFDVISSSYKAANAGQPLQTVITLVQNVSTSGLLTGNLSLNIPSGTPLRPFRTQLDDAWRNYGDHWLYDGQKDTLPVIHQPKNPEVVLSNALVPISDPQGYDYVVTYAAEAFTITTSVTLDTFEFHNVSLIGTNRPLNRRALAGYDDIRVYINDIREYGSYDELIDQTVEITGVTSIAGGAPADTWILAIGMTANVSIGDQIRIDDNVGGGSGIYLVDNVVGNVVTTNNAFNAIISTSTSTGTLSNITTPMTTITGGLSYVRGIKFFAGFTPNRFDVVRIEVGPATINGIGNFRVPVRRIVDNLEYIADGDEIVSLIDYRLVEQVKSKTNQYPLFDIYNADGTQALRANAIFGYKTSPDADVNPTLGLRMVADFDQRIFSFDQFLIDEDDGDIFAYRDYSNVTYDFWFNTTTNDLFFWDGLLWNKKTFMDTYYREAVVSDIEPGIIEQGINGLYWFDTLELQLYIRNTTTSSWDLVTNVDIRTSDNTIQSIWKKGLNDEEYIPAKVDWLDRTQEVYIAERDLFVTERAQEIVLVDPSITLIEATVTATNEWLTSQINTHSSTGAWVGDWEIPDPLYFNHMHENRKCITSRELLTHFSTIINAQPKIPGFNGPAEGMFHLIATGDVNYGLGGTIHEYNDGFDVFLSSIFVNNVTPRSLIEFGHDQYESLLNGLKEIYRKNAISFMTTTTDEALVDFSSYVSQQVINSHDANDYLSTIFGDTTTFNDDTNLGMRNWIITLPYMNLLRKRLPERLIDNDHQINQIVHHDGHRNDYFLTNATRENVIRSVINAPDDRTRFPTPADDPLDTFGRSSNVTLPPNNINEFVINFATSILGREGVYWYYTPLGTSNILYRLAVASAGPDEPSSNLDDGTLWMDLTVGFETLRIKTTDPITNSITWLPVEGLTVGDGRLHNGTNPLDLTTANISAWEPLDLDVVLGDVIYNVERRLYDNAPNPILLRYLLNDIQTLNQVKYDQYLLKTFNNFISQSEITTPFSNTEFSSSNAFTWNYKFSTPGAGIAILNADAITNTFVLDGNHEVLLDPCNASGPGFTACPSTISFFIKNSGVNDGTWTTTTATAGVPSAVYDAFNNQTTVSVQETVTDGITGVAYIGVLPNSINDGSESGGDWRDYYQKLYGTPYPHLEPWILQGYTDKPDWWDNEYLNDDQDRWGDRRWKYKHGFDIVGIDIVDDIFFIAGDFREIYTDGQSITLDQTPSALYDGSHIISQLNTITNVVVGTSGNATIEIPGNFLTELSVGTRFATSDNLGNLTGLFTVEQVIFTGPPGFNTIVTVVEDLLDATGIDNITGLTYDPVSNETSVRVTTDLTVNTFGGRILLHFGMWEQIRIGHIPAGQLYSNGITSILGDPITDNSIHGLRTPIIPTYNYFSVNIDNNTVDGNFQSDDVFPPYWDYTLEYTTAVPIFDRIVRSVFSNFSTEIVSPGANFSFGDAGPIEWEWRTSSQFLYDQLTIAFRIDPVRYVTHTFGVNFYDVAGLGIDVNTNKPLCHCRTNFHGEINDNNQLVEINGTNQWYVGFNRFNGFDASFADFRNLWSQWKAPLAYQFATFVDTPSLDIAHRHVNISEFDFDIAAKRAPGVEDYWYDVFDVFITKIPPSLSRYDNQLDWGLEINTNLPQSRTIKYYDVHNYQFYANPNTNTLTLFTWEIQEVDTFNKTFKIGGNQTLLFIPNRIFIVSDSTGNDGTYQIVTSAYNVVDNTTIIELDVLIPDFTADGTITLDYKRIPWITGDTVYLTTAETLPHPLSEKTGGGLIPYYIIVIDGINFKLATSNSNALTNVSLPIHTTGTRDHFVGELRSTFISNGAVRTTTLWRHYELDKNTVLEFTTPYDVQGMQTLVNIVDGYDVYTYDQGWRVNEDNVAIDPDTSRVVGWQSELERFIDYAFGLRTTNIQVVNKYEVSVNSTTNVWTFIEPEQSLVTGDSVNIFSSNGVYPNPIVQNITYFIIRDSATEFRLAATKRDAETGNPIVIISSVGVSELRIGITQKKDFKRRQEINPTRSAVWFRPNRGIVSNIIDGPSADVRTSHLIFDQNGHPIKESNLRVFREDKVTQLNIIEDLNPFVNKNDLDPYTFLHFGGMHLFIDAYEHVLLFNNYTSENVLIYDPFIGLNVTKYEMLFNRQVEFNERPNLGGYYLHTFFNQGADLRRNLEASVEDIRFMYDTHEVLESTDITEFSRKSLGYTGTREYLDNLNLHAKSQFLFWRGLIQSKGAVKSMQAFVNSRRFIDAKLDEYWAYKLADFGASTEKEYPEIYITTEDARTNDLRLQFVDDTDFCNPGYDTNVYDKEECGYAFPDSGDPVLLADPSFSPVHITDDDRWWHHPDQVQTLRNNGLNLHFTLKTNDKDDVYFSDIPGITIDSVSQTSFLGVNYATFIISGNNVPIPGSYIAVRGSVDDINTEYLVLDSSYNMTLSETTIVVNIPPFSPIPSILNTVVFLGPVSNPYQGWVVLNNDSLQYQYLTWNIRTSLWEHHGEWSVDIVDVDTPILRHNFAADAILVTLRLYSEGFNEEVLVPSQTKTLTLVNSYIPNTNGIKVFKKQQPLNPANTEFIQLTSGVDYVESLIQDISMLPSIGTLTLSDTILFRDDLLSTDIIKIVHTTSELIDTVHYSAVNANIVKINDQRIFDKALFPGLNNVSLWGLTTDEDAQNSAKLIDKTSQTVITPVQIWDPARGDHYTNAIHNIDLQNDLDPARYNRTSQTQERLPDQIYYIEPWTDSFVGTTWLNTTNLDYVPYYDTNVLPELEARLRSWGQLSDWGEVVAYEWVKSDILPSEWDAVALVEEGDATIPEGIRKSGTARKTLYEHISFIELTEFVEVTVTANNQNADGTFKIVTTFPVSTPVNVYVNTVFLPPEGLLIDEFQSVDLSVNIGDVVKVVRLEHVWKELHATYEEFDIVIEGTDLGNNVYSVDTTKFVIGDVVDVYVSGKLALANHELLSATIQVEVTIFDRIRVMKQIPTDRTFIDEEIEAQRLFEDYQYVEMKKHTDLGVEFSEYFFWVSDKGTKPDNKERSDTLKGLVPALKNIPAPYMFFQKITPKSSVLVEGDKFLSRIEQHITSLGQISVVTELPIAPGTVAIIVDGVPIPNANISYEEESRIINFPGNPQPGGQFMEVIYTGLYNETVNLPHRFVQMVARGLRGVVDADRRYTLRFTRDYTLRDDLDTGKTPLELKNLHAEWELFRENQPYHINKDLWDKITESIIQYKLTDNTIRVPSYERELYDAKFETSTQYGIGEGQAFVDGELALASILADLQNPNNNFQPVDINVFFERYNFDSPENIIIAMDIIYNTYSFEHVNRIYFSVLHDALSKQNEFADLIKTSMVSIHGVIPFVVGGLFDD